MAEKKMSLTYKELEDLLEGKGSEELLEKMKLARVAETNKDARQVAKDAIVTKSLTFIDGSLAGLDIPAGIQGISMVFPYIPADKTFITAETGLKIDCGDQLKVSDEIKHLVSLAEAAKVKKDNRPQSFLKTGLGDSRYTYITSLIAIDGGIGEQLEALYSSVNAASFNVDGIPEGDKAKVVIKYSNDVEEIVASAFSTVNANWYTTVTVGKTTTGGNGGTRRPRTAKPDGFKNWEAKVNESPEEHLVEGRKWLKEKYPTGDWSKSISAPKVLVKYKDAEFIQKRAEADARAEE